MFFHLPPLHRTCPLLGGYAFEAFRRRPDQYVGPEPPRAGPIDDLPRTIRLGGYGFGETSLADAPAEWLAHLDRLAARAAAGVPVATGRG